MNLPYIGQIKQLRQFVAENKLISPIEVGLASDEELIDTLTREGFSFVIPYRGGITTGEEILLIPTEALRHAKKLSR